MEDLVSQLRLCKPSCRFPVPLLSKKCEDFLTEVSLLFPISIQRMLKFMFLRPKDATVDIQSEVDYQLLSWTSVFTSRQSIVIDVILDQLHHFNPVIPTCRKESYGRNEKLTFGSF